MSQLIKITSFQNILIRFEYFVIPPNLKKLKLLNVTLKTTAIKLL